MKTRDFYFDLPDHLIAQKPAHRRSESRLMVVDKGKGTISHALMSDFPACIDRPSCLVVNNSKVRHARLYGRLETGTEVEVLFLEERERPLWSVMTNKTRRLKPGRVITFPGGVRGTVVGEEEGGRVLAMDPPLNEHFFSRYGHVPLPPYIGREDTLADADRYQTVYAEKIGSVAAPTAGLHFTREMMARIREDGSQIVPVTLHVGAGTFLPVRSQLISDHTMHYESYDILPEHAQAINSARRNGGKILAVGTTAVRTLESAAEGQGIIEPGEGRTNLFITPGYEFKAVDAMLTNFHTPESTLLMLVSAFAGYELIMEAYRTAVEREYRFFSYGDAMLIVEQKAE
jgi:S-adenosylmethionine:tRNA ribosyltransferase-isomerase